MNGMGETQLRNGDWGND